MCDFRPARLPDLLPDTGSGLNAGGTTTYGYDVENRLVQSTGGTNTSFVYDPLGRIHKAGSLTFLYAAMRWLPNMTARAS